MRTLNSNKQELGNKDITSANFGESVQHSMADIINKLEDRIEDEKKNDLLTNPSNTEIENFDNPKSHQIELGKRLKASRIRAGFTQNDIADRFDVNSSVISNYERGYRDPSSYKLRILADLYHVSVDYLLGRTDNMLLADTIASELSTIKDVKDKMAFLDGNNSNTSTQEPTEVRELTRTEIEDILNTNQFIRWYRESPESFSKELENLGKMAHLISQK